MSYTPYLVPVSVKGIVFENGKVWLRKNERNEWELPGGKIDPGEQPLDTVKREMLEELGFTVDVTDIIQADLYSIAVSRDENRGVLVICYACHILDKSGNFELEGEAGRAQFARFSLSEIPTLNMPEFYKIAINAAAEREK